MTNVVNSKDKATQSYKYILNSFYFYLFNAFQNDV
jgi:hypothetical protein